MRKKTQIVGFSLLILVCAGCPERSGVFQQTGNITFESFSNETVLANRRFEASASEVFVVKTTEPIVIGFRVDLDTGTRAKLKAMAKSSQNFDDNFSARVDQLPSGNGIGALDGGVIEMTPVNGEIRFEFRNLLRESHHFEVYSATIDSAR